MCALSCVWYTCGTGGVIHDAFTTSITTLYSLQEFPNLKTEECGSGTSHICRFTAGLREVLSPDREEPVSESQLGESMAHVH